MCEVQLYQLEASAADGNRALNSEDKKVSQSTSFEARNFLLILTGFEF